jgi:hypothetical protein
VTATTAVLGPRGHRDSFPVQLVELVEQARLVFQHRQDEIGVLDLAQEGRVGALGVQRIGRDHPAVQVQRGEQRLERRDLVALGRDLLLCQHDPVMRDRGQQVRCPVLAGAAGAAHGLAIHRQPRTRRDVPAPTRPALPRRFTHAALPARPATPASAGGGPAAHPPGSHRPTAASNASASMA